MRRKKKMETSRTIEFTFEKSETRILRRRPRAYCPECGRDASLLAPEHVAQLLGLSTRSIYRTIEAAEIHFVESDEGVLLICLESAERRLLP